MNARRFKVVDVDESPVEDVDAIEHDRDLDGEIDDLTVLGDDIEIDATDDDEDVADEVDNGADDDDTSSDDDATEAPAEVSAAPAIPGSHPRVSEAVRYLLDRYGMTAAREFPAVIACVSALRKEGVTTVSQSLAEVLSVDFGYTVCWVDLSWAEGAPTAQKGLRRRLSRRRNRSRGGSRQPGILDVVGGDATLEDVLRTSDDNKIAHLGAGRTSVPLREITRSVELQDLFDELMSKFEIVVFDNAPVSENSSALSLIQYAEAYLFVTQFGATTAQQVTEATQMLDPLPAMGAVLNSYRSRTPRAIRRFFAADR